MTVRTFHGIDEVAAAIGEHVGHSDWHEVTQDRIDAFAEATGDHQWIHVDPARAAQGPFGTTIAHGYLTLSLVPMLTWEIFAIDGLSMQVNYGSEKVRFPAPVPVGSTVRAGIELVKLVETTGGHRLHTLVSIEVDGGTKPALVTEVVTFLVP